MSIQSKTAITLTWGAEKVLTGFITENSDTESTGERTITDDEVGEPLAVKSRGKMKSINFTSKPTSTANVPEFGDVLTAEDTSKYLCGPVRTRKTNTDFVKVEMTLDRWIANDIPN